MTPSVAKVDAALPALRALLEEAKVPYLLVGGLAVVHHGYVRSTEDIDLLIDGSKLEKLDPLLAKHGFEPGRNARLRHVSTGVSVDLLVSGQGMPRPGSPPYPAPQQLTASDEDCTVVSLAGLLELKLNAQRHQDRADVVALLKLLDDPSYDQAEAELPPTLRPQLLALRRDALEELSWEDADS